VLALLAVLAPLPAAPAWADTCSGVWVVVESDVRCATSFSTGMDALRSAGFEVQTEGEFVCRIGGRPDTCTMKAPYWSYWQAERDADGRYGAWQYATTGPAGYHPVAGAAEGWSFGDSKQPAGLPGQPSAAPASPTPDSPTAPPATTPPATPTATPTTLPASAPSANAGTPVAALLTVGVLVAAGAGVAVLVLRRGRH